MNNLPNDKDLRLITYKTLLEKFNQKYLHLNKQQKSLLKAYINNISNTGNLTEHLNIEAARCRKKITTFANKIDDKITSIKLLEVANQLKKIQKSRTVNEAYLTRNG